MKNRFLALRDRLSSSYWFIPIVMAVLAVVLSILTIQADQVIGSELGWLSGLIYVDSPEAARAVLSTVASSMITVAGVVFSLTMVVLSLSSQQYGPLVLAHFMRDRGNQFVLGIFTATFIYCLLILRTISGVVNSIFVPHISVLIGIGLSIVSLAVLIYFIHHVSQSIQSPNIVARISDDLMHTIDDLFPARLGEELSKPGGEQGAQQLLLQRFDQESEVVKTQKSGYLQIVDDNALLKTAATYQLIVQIGVLPGTFLFKGQTLVRVISKERCSDDIYNKLQDAFIFGSQRTRTQDVEFVITQLSALAVRALSPSTNDPYTAIMVIDHLGEALCAVLDRPQPSIYRYDADNQLRVIAASETFERVFHTAFDQICHYGNSDPKVVVRLLQVFKALWQCSDDLGDRNLLQRSTTRLYEESRDQLLSSEDERLNQVYADIARDFQVQ